VFLGGGAAAWGWHDHSWRGPTYVGVIDMLVFFSVLVLLFRGEYPRSIFDFVLGLNRWVLRAVAYAALMTPEYPPYRIDGGEAESVGMLSVAAPVPTRPAESAAPTSEPAVPPQARTAGDTREHWGPGRVIALVAASILAIASLGLLATGGAGIVLDQTQRNSSGYLMTSSDRYSTSTYAVVSGSYRGGAAGDWFVSRDLIGTVKLRVSSARRVFVGIGPETSVDTYMAGVAHARGSSLTAPNRDYRTYRGGAPNSPPGVQRFWSATSTGSGQQTLTWKPQAGNWRIVLMNADGSAGVSSDVSIGANMPHLLGIGIAAAGVGLLLLAIGVTGIYLVARPTGSGEN
jgi:Domain of unknown function (DUF4389)